MLTQFSLGKYVLDVAADNMDGFPECEKCVSSSQLNGLFVTKRAYLYFENLSCRKYF
jgi:hypothetical protein